MTLFSGASCPQCHRARIVLAEKGITYDIVEVKADEFPEDLLDLNPYGSVPTLVDRDLVLYYARVIIEYLDERFPHPPLMPVDPVSRARARLALTRIEYEWFPQVERLASAEADEADEIRKSFRESLVSSAELFALRPYFLSDDFSLVDCTIAPILWRLPVLGIELPEEAASVSEYASRVFQRESFRKSLSDAEREMRP